MLHYDYEQGLGYAKAISCKTIDMAEWRKDECNSFTWDHWVHRLLVSQVSSHHVFAGLLTFHAWVRVDPKSM